MFTIDNGIEHCWIKENKTISEKRISPQVVRIKMDISILELRGERLNEEIKELKIKLRQAEKREKST